MVSMMIAGGPFSPEGLLKHYHESGLAPAAVSADTLDAVMAEGLAQGWIESMLGRGGENVGRYRFVAAPFLFSPWVAGRPDVSIPVAAKPPGVPVPPTAMVHAPPMMDRAPEPPAKKVPPPLPQGDVHPDRNGTPDVSSAALHAQRQMDLPPLKETVKRSVHLQVGLRAAVESFRDAFIPSELRAKFHAMFPRLRELSAHPVQAFLDKNVEAGWLCIAAIPAVGGGLVYGYRIAPAQGEAEAASLAPEHSEKTIGASSKMENTPGIESRRTVSTARHNPRVAALKALITFANEATPFTAREAEAALLRDSGVRTLGAEAMDGIIQRTSSWCHSLVFSGYSNVRLIYLENGANRLEYRLPTARRIGRKGGGGFVPIPPRAAHNLSGILSESHKRNTFPRNPRFRLPARRSVNRYQVMASNCGLLRRETLKVIAAQNGGPVTTSSLFDRIGAEFIASGRKRDDLRRQIRHTLSTLTRQGKLVLVESSNHVPTYRAIQGAKFTIPR